MNGGQSLLNAMKLVGKNKGEKKALIAYVQKNGLKTLEDMGRKLKNRRKIKEVEYEMLLYQIEEEACQEQ
jgi:hypothetical protein